MKIPVSQLLRVLEEFDYRVAWASPETGETRLLRPAGPGSIGFLLTVPDKDGFSVLELDLEGGYQRQVAYGVGEFLLLNARLAESYWGMCCRPGPAGPDWAEEIARGIEPGLGEPGWIYGSVASRPRPT